MSRVKGSLISGIIIAAVIITLVLILFTNQTTFTGLILHNGQPIIGYVTFRRINESGEPFGETFRFACSGKYEARLQNNIYEMRAFYKSGKQVGIIGKAAEIGPFSRTHDFIWEAPN